MLNLDDLNSVHGANFFDVSGIQLKRAPDEDDDDCDNTLRVRRLPSSYANTSSVGSRRETSPWEFDFSSLRTSQAHHVPPPFSDGYGIRSGVDPRYLVTLDTSFAILGDDDRISAAESGLLYLPTSHEPSSSRRRMSYVVVSVVILLCIGVHVMGQLVFFTPWYDRSIQTALFRSFYSSFSASGFQTSIAAKREAVATVYLLIIGLTPTVLAASLWFTFASQRELRRLIEIPGVLRHKPVLFSKWRPIYIDASCGEILLLGLIGLCNGVIFIFSLLRSNTELVSPNTHIWRDVSIAFAHNAMFNLVWLLVFIPTPSPWTVYLDFLGVSNVQTSIKYRNWFAWLVLACSLLHGSCIVTHFQLLGELTTRLFPDSRTLLTDPSAGMVVFGEITLGAMVVLAAVIGLGRRIPLVVAHILGPLGCAVCLLALCVHYPVAIVWMLPTLVPLLIQKAVSWTHSRYPVELVDMAPLPNGITRLVLRRHVDKMDTSGSNFVAGQSVNVRLAQVSWMQWQRCTIATSPLRHPGTFTIYTHDPVSPTHHNISEYITARETHDFAKVAYATKKAPIVYVDGFYGPSHPICYEKYRCLVFVAAETGVIEVLSILEQLYHEAWLAVSNALDAKLAREINGDTNDTTRSDDLNPTKRFDKQVWLLWTCEDVCLFKEFEELFFRIKALDPSEQHFKLRFFLTKIPLREDLQYERLASAAFRCGSNDPTETKGASRDLDDCDSTNPCRRPRHVPPQNRSSLSCWSSRPFQQSVSSAFVRALTLVLVAGAVVPVCVLVVWHTLRAKASGAFPMLQLLRNVVLLLLTCAVVTGMIALINDALLSCQRTRQDKLYNDAKHHMQRAERSAPSRGLKKLRSMTKMTGEVENEAVVELQRGSYQSDSMTDANAVGPDVMERLMIYSMRPDVDKFLRTVGRSFPSFAGTIGVFASGDATIVEQVEASTLACAASAGEWHDVKAELDFHRLG